ncbi:hypothetical protein FOYG_14085 [Fusarium oxysporum NRRL 32931]|uniref:Uncharacterized protein n=1 Tax=Fusarium oxysporum NRRL 32931 TaxID=660029 RepID=W9HNX9_FUSOX|nr:hypothetical protein FOYG_14085 [Fusarium oxysporum NRRL 32931]
MASNFCKRPLLEPEVREAEISLCIWQSEAALR